jgi:hypothetical protein
MDFAATYCPIRRDLQERTWFLTNRHSTITTRLLDFVGLDHDEFLERVEECRSVHLEIVLSRVKLQEHRLGHGC